MTSLAAQQPSPPARIGQYEILCELGRGGMAVLYLARVVGLGGFERLFALKMIHDDLGRDPEFVRMFLDEARLVARIRHPNVVPVYEVGVDQGRYFIAMDYVSGETLGAALAATWPRKRPFPMALATHIIAMAGEGLHAAHELTDQRGESLGVIHRDVAPGNIMLGYDGAVRVMDFGVAKAVDQAGGGSVDPLKGTLAYMAPELMRGTSRADRRADVFALGVLLWEMCVGKRLFKGRTDVETARRVMRLDVPVPSSIRPELPPSLDDVILRALAREPGQRPSTARALSEELQQVLASAGHVTTSGDVERFLREHFAERLVKRREMERKAAQETVPDDLEGVIIEEEPPLPEQVDDADIEPLSEDEVSASPLEGASGPQPPHEHGPVGTASAALGGDDPAALDLAALDASLASALDAAVATALDGASRRAEMPELEDGLVVVGPQRARGEPLGPRAAPERSVLWSMSEQAERPARADAAWPEGGASMTALAALAAQEPDAQVVATPRAPSAPHGGVAASSRARTPSPLAPIARAPTPAPEAGPEAALASSPSDSPTESAATPAAPVAPRPRGSIPAEPTAPMASMASSVSAARAQGSIPAEPTAPMASMASSVSAARAQGSIPAEPTAPMASMASSVSAARAPGSISAEPTAPMVRPRSLIGAEPTAPMGSPSPREPLGAVPADFAPEELLAGIEASDTEQALVVPVRTARLLEQREPTMVVRTRRVPREPVPLDAEARAREDREVEVLVREAQGSRLPALIATGVALVLALGAWWWSSAHGPRVIVPMAQVAAPSPREPEPVAPSAALPSPASAERAAIEALPPPVSPSPASAERAAIEALPPPVSPSPAPVERAGPEARPPPSVQAAAALPPRPPSSVAARARAPGRASAAPRASAAAAQRPAATRSPSPRPSASPAARARPSPAPRRTAAPALISGSDL